MGNKATFEKEFKIDKNIIRQLEINNLVEIDNINSLIKELILEAVLEDQQNNPAFNNKIKLVTS